MSQQPQILKSGYIVQSYIFDPRPAYPLLTTAKRYSKPGTPLPYLPSPDPSAMTLVFTHGTSFGKEMWEPVIDDLEELLDNSDGVRIREIWAIDCPNHGDAALLNEEELLLGYDKTFGWEEYARSVHLFLAGKGTGVNADFSKHNLVGIGHSMGAVALGLSLGYYPRINFTSLILCEIMMLPEAHYVKAGTILSSGSARRRDIWPSKEDAYKLLRERGTWKSWDERSLKIYVESGLRNLPTRDYPDKTEGVTLKCSKIHETASYKDYIGSMRLYSNFKPVIKAVPTHLIYGGIDDYVSAEAKQEVLDVAVGGIQNLASYSRVPKAGHLLVQMNPKGVAEKVFDALKIVARGRGVKSAKL